MKDKGEGDRERVSSYSKPFLISMKEMQRKEELSITKAFLSLPAMMFNHLQIFIIIFWFNGPN